MLPGVATFSFVYSHLPLGPAVARRGTWAGAICTGPQCSPSPAWAAGYGGKCGNAHLALLDHQGVKGCRAGVPSRKGRDAGGLVPKDVTFLILTGPRSREDTVTEEQGQKEVLVAPWSSWLVHRFLTL